MNHTPEQKDYKAQLAESQAREAKLRNIAEEMSVQYSGTARAYYEAIISAPPDATALNELITKAGEVMRVKCRRELLGKSIQLDTIHIITNAIHALPGVTMEDLK